MKQPETFSLTPTDNPLPRSTFGDIGAFFQVRSKRRAFSNALLEIPYSRAKARRIDEQTLRLFRWDKTSRSLVLVPSSGVDVERRRVWGRISEPGLYGAIGLPRDPDVLRTIGMFALFSAEELRTSPELIPPICGLVLCRPDAGGSLCDLCLGIEVPEAHLPEVQSVRFNPGRVFVAVPPGPPQPPIWPGVFHDYRNTLQSAQNGPSAQPSIVWDFYFGASAVVTTPVVAPDGTVYIAAAGYSANASVDLYGFTGDTGQIKWSVQIANTGPMPAQTAVGSDGTVYVNSLTAAGDGKLDAFHPYGSLKWTFTRTGRELGFPMPGSDGSVYVLSKSEGVIRIDDTGTASWAAPFAVGNPLNPPNFTPVAVRNDASVIIRTTAGISAVAPNGQVLWTYSDPDDLFPPPTVANDGRVILVMQRNSPRILVLNSGGAFQADWPMSPLNYVAAGRNGNVYFTSGRDLWAVRPAGTVIWSRVVGAPLSASLGGPAIGTDGTLYVTTGVPFLTGVDVHAIDPVNGNDKWIAPIRPPTGSGGGVPSGPPVIGMGGTLLIVVSNTLFAIR